MMGQWGAAGYPGNDAFQPEKASPGVQSAVGVVHIVEEPAAGTFWHPPYLDWQPCVWRTQSIEYDSANVAEHRAAGRKGVVVQPK